MERNGNTSLNNQKSLARWLENLLFWPKSNESYVSEGNEAAKKLHDNIYTMNNDVFKIN